LGAWANNLHGYGPARLPTAAVLDRKGKLAHWPGRYIFRIEGQGLGRA
jgi:hypothetical protein